APPIPALGLLQLPPLLCNHSQLVEHNSLVLVVADRLEILFETVVYRLFTIKVTAIVCDFASMPKQHSPKMLPSCDRLPAGARDLHFEISNEPLPLHPAPLHRQ